MVILQVKLHINTSDTSPHQTQMRYLQNIKLILLELSCNTSLLQGIISICRTQLGNMMENDVTIFMFHFDKQCNSFEASKKLKIKETS